MMFLLSLDVTASEQRQPTHDQEINLLLETLAEELKDKNAREEVKQIPSQKTAQDTEIIEDSLSLGRLAAPQRKTDEESKISSEKSSTMGSGRFKFRKRSR